MNYIEGQGIVISARKGQTYNPNYNPNSNDARFSKEFGNFASTKLMSNDRFQYGHIQFKAKIPNFSGILPAIWLVNDDNRSLFSEIDIAEVPGSEKNNSYVVTHYGPTPNSLTTDYSYKNLPKISSEFQTYDVYRLPGRLVVLYNGNKVFDKNTWQTTINGVNALEVPMRFILNLNVGDKWAGSIDQGKFPAQMTVKEIVMEHY
jgi:beta-glucanase (GH16 family)